MWSFLGKRSRYISYAPTIFNGGTYSITDVHKYVPSVCMKNGFLSISFEKISVFDSYFIHGI